MQPTLCQPASTASVNRLGILLGRRAPPDYRSGSLREDCSAVSFSSHRREKEYGAHDDSTSDEILRRPRLPVTQADGLPPQSVRDRAIVAAPLDVWEIPNHTREAASAGACSSAGRAHGLQPWGREFDPRQVHQLTLSYFRT